MGFTTGAGNHRPICTICYEDLKPIAEDLQTIPNCGHVFHELCLQQWLEYCPAGKKPNCPFCKQSCSHHHPTRLYFQSTGDPTELSASQRAASSEADAEALAEEVRRLEAKLSSLASTFESQQTHLKKLNDEVSVWKELAKTEETKKEEIKKEKECSEQFLRIKMEELSRKSSECSKLEERCLGLAKELAALKLVTDLNLGEEEMGKLASVGHRGNYENMVDVLKKSLALRNKSYKELMAQCNHLGRAETRTQQKLDKAKEKIRKLTARTQELEKTLEEKENGILRDLKASYQFKAESVNLSSVKQSLDSPSIRNRPLQDQPEKPVEALVNSNQIKFSSNHPFHSNRNVNGPAHQFDFASSAYKENDSVMDLESDSFFLIDDDALELSPNLYKPPTNASPCQNKPGFVSIAQAQQHISPAAGSWSSDIGMMNVEKTTMEKTVGRNEIHIASSTWTAEKLLIDDISKQVPSVAFKTEARIHDSGSSPGDPCFPGGIRGLEGANRNTGKWGRLNHTKASTSNGNLIAVGADGRGGRVKVLRAHDQFLDGKAKRQKNGAKQSGQSQIENFFGKS